MAHGQKELHCMDMFDAIACLPCSLRGLHYLSVLGQRQVSELGST